MAHQVFVCSYCDRNFFRHETAEDHVLSSPQCRGHNATCEIKYKKLWNSKLSNSLVQSMASSYLQERFICMQCPAEFFNRGHMKAHMRQGHPTLPLVFQREDLITGKIMTFDETPQGMQANRKFFNHEDTVIKTSLKNSSNVEQIHKKAPRAMKKNSSTGSLEKGKSLEGSLPKKASPVIELLSTKKIITEANFDGFDQQDSKERQPLPSVRNTPIVSHDGRLVTSGGHSFKVVSSNGVKVEEKNKIRLEKKFLDEEVVGENCRNKTKQSSHANVDSNRSAAKSQPKVIPLQSAIKAAETGSVKRIRLKAADLKRLLLSKNNKRVDASAIKNININKTTSKNKYGTKSAIFQPQERVPVKSVQVKVEEVQSSDKKLGKETLPNRNEYVTGSVPRVIKVPPGTSSEGLQKLLSTSFGSDIKIKVVPKVPGPINILPEKNISTNETKFSAVELQKDKLFKSHIKTEIFSKPSGTPEIHQQSLKLNYKKHTQVNKQTNRKPCEPKKIQLPVDSLLMSPKNHKYLHPNFHPVLRLRRLPSSVTEKLFQGKTMIYKGPKSASVPPSLETSTTKYCDQQWNDAFASRAFSSISPLPKDLTIDFGEDEAFTYSSARKCCPVCMKAFEKVSPLRSHIHQDHNVDPFGYVEMDESGGISNFVPFGTGDDLGGIGDDDRTRGNKKENRKRSLDVDNGRIDDDKEISDVKPNDDSHNYPPGSSFTCTSCGDSFAAISSLRSHLLQVHGMRTDRRRGISCLVTDPVLGTTELVKMKVIASPTKPSPTKVKRSSTHTFSCTICYEEFNDLDFIRAHCRCQHKATKISFLKKNLTTGEAEIINESAGYEAHGTSKFDFFCPFCKSQFFAVSGLRQHCERLHGVKDFHYSYRDPATGKTFYADSFTYSKVDAALRKTGYKTNLDRILSNAQDIS